MTILDRIAKLDRVLILGFAREGRSTYQFLRSQFPGLQIDFADQKTPDQIPSDPKTQSFFGPDYLSCLTDYRLIIKSPGVSPHRPEIAAVAKQGTVITSHTQIFFELCPGQIIGVTGTKGKSTACSLIYHVLSQNQIPAVLVGNIGQPALDFLPKINPRTWVVMELSSYQLMDLTISPHIAVMLNIVSDHLDYHPSFSKYVAAKRNIVRFQKSEDYFVYNADFPLPRETASLTPAQKIPFSLSDFDPAIKTQLIGEHNKYNILPSLKIAAILRLPQDKTYAAISSFTPLQTRLQLVSEINGIKFYEDTLATIPEATIAAIDALSPRIGTLIAGGYERKQNYLNLARKILNSNIKTLIVFPDTGPRIWSETQKIGGGKINYFLANSMPDAVKLAIDHTASGKICLLSPAAPSFTLFKNYLDESAQYREALTHAANTV